MDQEVLKALADPTVFALLAVKTVEGEVVVRPVGGDWGSGIRDAVQEMAEKYPGARMQLFSRESDYERYFEGIVPKDQVLPYAEFSPKAKAALERLRQKLATPPWHCLQPELCAKGKE